MQSVQHKDSEPKTVLRDNKYLYNGKELQDESLGGINLDWYDSRSIIHWVETIVEINP